MAAVRDKDYMGVVACRTDKLLVQQDKSNPGAARERERKGRLSTAVGQEVRLPPKKYDGRTA